jgi:dTDP-4-dehydrorhamnose reductase
MRAFVTGSNGLVGTELVKLCLGRGHEVFSGYTDGALPAGVPIRVDLADAASLPPAFERSRPEAVFHLAAMTDVDRCEVETKRASRINEDGTRTVAYLAKKHGARLVFVSTDYVFSGAKGLYREEDTPLPVNHYGYTKLMGEEAVVESGAEHIIARPSVVYGPFPAPGEVNFALWLYESLKAGKEVQLLTDQFVSPTLNTSLATMLLEACEEGLTTRVSRHGFGVSLAEVFGLDKQLIRPAVMEDFHGRWVARRPPDSSLDTSKAAAALRAKPLVLNQALAELKREIDG